MMTLEPAALFINVEVKGPRQWGHLQGMKGVHLHTLGRHTPTLHQKPTEVFQGIRIAGPISSGRTQQKIQICCKLCTAPDQSLKIPSNKAPKGIEEREVFVFQQEPRTRLDSEANSSTITCCPSEKRRQPQSSSRKNVKNGKSEDAPDARSVWTAFATVPLARLQHTKLTQRHCLVPQERNSIP